LAAGFERSKNESYFEMVSYDHKFEALRVDRFEFFRTDKHRHHSSRFLLKDRRDNKLKEYVYDRKTDSCTTKTDNRPFPKFCVRENHKQEFKFTIGLGYHVVWYGYDHKDARREIVVSEHGCAPISGHFFEHHHFEDRVDFWDVKLGIGNPIVFELPAACH